MTASDLTPRAQLYGPLKMQLDNNFLMGKQEYPSNVLLAKRLMTDFVAATGAVKHKRQESGPSEVAFVKTGDGGKWSLTCYCCGEWHEGGYMKCPNVSEAVRQRTIKVVKAGHFTKKQDDDSTISTKAWQAQAGGVFPRRGLHSPR